MNCPGFGRGPFFNAPSGVIENLCPMLFGSVCSGIEAASVAWEPLGWRPAFFSEIEPFPSAVLAHHWPSVPNLGDFTRIDGDRYPIELLVGGTPCQAFSVAGARRSLDDERGNLTLQFVKLVHATSTLRWVVWENVPGVLSTRDNAFGCFLGGLVGADEPLCVPGGKRWPDAGMVAGPLGRAAWRVFDAQYFRLAQRRKRVFVVFCPSTSRGDPSAVLFERQSGGGNNPPSRQQGEKPSPTLSARTKDGGGLGTDFDLDGGLIPHVSPTLLGGGNNTGGHRPPGSTVDNCESLIPVAYPILECGARTGVSTTDIRAGMGIGDDGDPMFTLQASKQHGVGTAFGVRRLTPVECARLQGFSDDHAAIPWRGKAETPDGPQYKAYGNSMAVNVMRWIGERIQAQAAA